MTSSHLLAAILLAAAPAVALAGSLESLAELDLEALADVRVSLPSRHSEPILTTPAAVFVISREDIARSGVTTIADALRMVPGLQVARMEANKWAVTSRGFDGRFARHMLVQIDGRSVYTPLFSGVFWEAQDVLLEDVDRIEVVRGPGGTMWGANAVNGVVNIVTRSAKETQGLLLELGGGTEERGFFGVRIGEKAGPDTYVRVYAKAFDRDGGEVDGRDGSDDWRAAQAGFRIDCEHGQGNSVTLSGDTYAGTAGQRLLNAPDGRGGVRDFEDEASYSGDNLLLKWRVRTGPQSDFTLSSYLDETRRSEYAFNDERRTLDVDAQHELRGLGSHNLLWGVGYRGMRDHLPPTPVQSHSSDSRQDAIYSAFVQDTVTLWPERLTLVAGSKVERNDYSGWEVQPGIRATCTPSARQTWWCSVSRAVRTPSRAESTVRLNCMLQRPNMTFMGQPHLPAEFVADGGFGPESVVAYELGHRMQVLDDLTADVAAFYNSYRDLQSLEPVAGTLPVRFVLRNNVRGEAFGAEATARWLLFTWWKLQISYAYMDLHLSAREGSGDIFTERTYEEDVPHHQASLLSRWNLPAGVQVDGWLRYVDPIPIESIPSYLEMDLRAACPIGRNVELSVAARNILHDSHTEYGPSFMLATETTEVERSVYAKLTCRFR